MFSKQESLALASMARDDPPACKQHGEQHGARKLHGGRNAR